MTDGDYETLQQIRKTADLVVDNEPVASMSVQIGFMWLTAVVEWVSERASVSFSICCGFPKGAIYDIA
ncbi:MAG: hypothetical protein R3A44_08260 [Caldilineaceae bacterium]